MSKPIHTASGKPQCQEPFTTHAGNQERCTRPEGHDSIHATAFASERKDTRPRSCPQCGAQPWRSHRDDCPEVPAEDAEPERYPAQVSVCCDSCGHTHSGDYIVGDSDDKATRFGYARAHLSREGWWCDERGDYCPRCLLVALDRQL